MRNQYLQVYLDEAKPRRYKVSSTPSSSNQQSDYYSPSELYKLDSQIRVLTKQDRKEKKDKLLFSPEYKRRMFTPYELISREVRNIYLYLPYNITLDKK